MKKGWLAPARWFAGGAFTNNALGNEILHEHASHAATHVHAAGQVRARDWLPLTNKVEYNSTVDLPRGGARSDTEVSSVYLTHRQTAVVVSAAHISHRI